ncbi:leucine-rich repeat neuronal protein 1 isoform X4 [Girardinichthys multiradiatus]|uniref:leucine-rich repeat neuronal protein 1 isoform X4 n=1 Tax=Girardinichthys multiradiatus TaxID=208333 RepID=UPI001FAC9743|nr:leucine-rich repeat neuronal protein 1 isoform X4 [Girardinichthys multiradiatus]
MGQVTRVGVGSNSRKGYMLQIKQLRRDHRTSDRTAQVEGAGPISTLGSEWLRAAYGPAEGRSSWSSGLSGSERVLVGIFDETDPNFSLILHELLRPSSDLLHPQCIMGSVVLSVLLHCLLTSSVCVGVGVASPGGAVMCPLQCVCETRPWYTSQSVYHQARTVDCNELHLHRVPTNISADTQVLLLQSNNISIITTELQSIRNMTELDLSQNRFTQVSSMGLSSLVHLVTLYIEENHIEELEDFGLRNLSSLEELYINHNHISSIGPKAFAGLTSLLRLNNMEDLLMVERAAFQNLPEITKLELCNNPRLSYIDPQAFRDLPSLRTLLLLNNKLSLLSGDLLSTLPSLEELSLHSNPLRCDCLPSWGPHLGNQSHLKLLESSITVCSSPPHLIGRELQEVVAFGWGGGGANSCLPHISPDAFPPIMNVSAGQPITLECWADADPAPQFYWVTPTGDKVSSELVAAPIKSEQGRGLSRKKKHHHHMSEPGALVIEQAEPSDAGVYTCVAWNVEGADTKSISVSVDSQGSGQGSPWGVQPGKRRLWYGNSSSSAASLVVLAKVVHAQSVVLEWKLYFSRGASSVGQNQHDADLPLPRWTSAVVHIDNPQISYTAKVPADVQEYNLTHLLPATEYNICLTVSSPPTPHPTSLSSSTLLSAPVHTSCLNVTTKEAGFSVELVASQHSSVALAAVLGSMFALSIMMLLVVYMGRRVHQHKSCGQSLKKYMQHTTSIPMNELYPPLITLWESEAEKDKGDKEEEEGREEAEWGEGEAGRSQINTNKTYIW